LKLVQSFVPLFLYSRNHETVYNKKVFSQAAATEAIRNVFGTQCFSSLLQIRFVLSAFISFYPLQDRTDAAAETSGEDNSGDQVRVAESKSSQVVRTGRSG